MKDLLKKLLCVIMALTMIAALCACGGDKKDDEKEDKETKTTEDGKTEPEETEEEAEEETEEETEEEEEKTEPKKEKTLVGEWEANINVGEIYSEMLGVEIDELYLTWSIEFEDNGDYTMEMDVDSFIEDYKSIYWDLVVQASAQQQGCTEEEAEEMMEAVLEEQDMTKEEFVDYMMESNDMTADTFGKSKTSGEWELDGDELYMNGEAVDIEFDGDEFSITGGDLPEEAAELLEMMLPIVFERV